MSKHAHDAGALRRLARATCTRLVAWHDAAPARSFGIARGWVWMALVAAVFFWMSNPLVFVPSFYLSLAKAITWTEVVVIVTLPWIRLPRVPWPWMLFLGLAAVAALDHRRLHTPTTQRPLPRDDRAGVGRRRELRGRRSCAWGLGLGGVVVVSLSIYAFREEMWGLL